MSDETNRDAAACTVVRVEAAAARLPWATPTLSCIFAAEAQIGSGDGGDADSQVS